MKLLRTVVVSLFLMVLFAVPTLALEDPVAPTDKPEESLQEPKPKPETAADREARLKKRKETTKERLDAKKERVVAQRCKASQAKVKAQIKRLENVKKSREKAYSTRYDGVLTLAARLKDKGLDTTQLAANLVVLDGKIDTFTVTIDGLITALKDASALDCEADPQGFYVSLSDARTKHKTLISDTKAIKDQFAVVKKDLADLKAQLGGDTPKPEGN